MSQGWIPRGVVRRRASTALILIGGFAAFQLAANAAHPLAIVRHLGPLGLVAGQEAVVTLANVTPVSITTTITLFDANASVLDLQTLTVAPHDSEAVRWVAPGATRVRATVSTPGTDASRYPIGLFLYDAGAQNPALAAPVNGTLRHPPSSTSAALSPYVPLLVICKNVVGVVNLGLTSATFTVSFFDDEGDTLSVQTLTIAPLRTGVAQVPAPQLSGVRSEVQAPAGTPYLVSSEIVDEATGRTLAVLLGR
jgi:hypothetical protein